MTLSTPDRLAVIGDPRRRAILEMLSTRPSSVARLARQLPVTRSAVSQHLRVLKDAGLVADHADGTQRIYRIDPSGLAALRDYLHSLWEAALAGFAAAAEGSSTQERARRPARSESKGTAGQRRRRAAQVARKKRRRHDNWSQ